MFYTKRVDEEFAFTEPDLEGLLLQKTLTFHHDQQQVGEVIVFAHKYLPERAVLQAEFYRTPLSSDIFFEKGLVHRENVFKPLQTTSLQGIVLSKSSGIILPHVENHFLVREKDIPVLLERRAYQQQHCEEFCDYVAVGSSAMGFLGYDHQPVGEELREKIFLSKGKEVDAIKKETRVKEHAENKSGKNGAEEDAVYNGGLFLRKKIFNDFTVTVGRTSFILQREGQGLYLRNQQMACLGKALEYISETLKNL